MQKLPRREVPYKINADSRPIFSLSLSILLVLLGSFEILRILLTIDCYHCASLAGDHKECEDVFARDITTEHLISRECTSGYWRAKFCIKLKGKRVDGTSILIRQCAQRDWGSHCGLIQLDATGTNRFEDIDGCVETCDFDGCNLATTTHCNIPMICLTVISCLLLWTRWQFL
ncbi:hypothetical protein MAR_028324 [Mya arenaria]|uniref:Protein quiver n=1 Tax=Mya arenaria TaxID=6604 RepID=A0ABY7DEE9_MYAAR|nr:hypothetical protein MAR_028324 [Mya arenaria]